MPETPKPITFTIRGRLPGKQSVRVARGHSYMPQKTRAGMDAVRAAFELAAPKGWKPWAGPVSLTFGSVRVPPASWPAWKRGAAMAALDTAKPDLSNVLKLIEDALNGVAYTDDAHVAVGRHEKRYGDEDAVMVVVGFRAGLPATKAELEKGGKR